MSLSTVEKIRKRAFEKYFYFENIYFGKYKIEFLILGFESNRFSYFICSSTLADSHRTRTSDRRV